MNHEAMEFDYSKATLLFYLEKNNTPIESANEENFYTSLLKWRKILEEKFSQDDIMIDTYLFYNFATEEISSWFSEELECFKYTFPSSLRLYYMNHLNDGAPSFRKEIVLYKGKTYIIYSNLPQLPDIVNHPNFDNTHQIYWTPLYLAIKVKKWSEAESTFYKDKIIVHVPENIKEGVFIHES